MEILVVISFLFNIIVCGWCFCVIKLFQSRENDLLNRLMAKDYKEYANYEHIKQISEPEPPRTFTDAAEDGVYPVN